MVQLARLVPRVHSARLAQSAVLARPGHKVLQAPLVRPERLVTMVLTARRALPAQPAPAGSMARLVRLVQSVRRARLARLARPDHRVRRGPLAPLVQLERPVTMVLTAP